jgi:HD superfamily phosphohydrolase
VSSELDADRMDYLERDSYFCGTNYGKVDSHWLVGHMTSHAENQKVYLALNRRALYTFDDFLLSRHHMHLMVYFHHKSIIYEELLNRYLTSPDCQFRLPADINEYTKYNDHKLFENIATSSNPWAQRIYQKKLYKVLLELHSTETSPKPQKIKEELEAHNIDVIWASSHARLSKYHTPLSEEKALPMFVVDPYNRWDKPHRIDETTEIFSRYEGTRIIDRLYVKPEDLDLATKIISQKKF